MGRSRVENEDADPVSLSDVFESLVQYEINKLPTVIQEDVLVGINTRLAAVCGVI